MNDEGQRQLVQRLRASETVRVERFDEDHFVAYGSSDEYLVSLTEKSCECSDFRYRSKMTGVPCKHVLAALAASGLLSHYLGTIGATGPAAFVMQLA